MRHNVVITVGSSLGTVARDMTLHVARYASVATATHFKALWWHVGEDGTGEFSPITLSQAGDDFRADLQGEVLANIEHGTAIPADNKRVERFEGELMSLFNSTITIGSDNGSTNTLLITAVVSLRDTESIEALLEIERAARACNSQFTIDVVALCHDVASLFNNDVSAGSGDALTAVKQLKCEDHESLTRLLQSKQQPGNVIGHIMPIANINSAGRSLNLDSETAVRLLGELVMIEIEKYDDLWNFPIDPRHELTAVGLSALLLDDFYFAQYLLRKAYLHVLSREGVTQNKVDINKISPVANRCVHICMSRFATFWQTEVVPLIGQQPDDEIVATVSPLVTDLFRETIFRDLTSYLQDSSLSLPERQCVLALVLGFDDTLLGNYLFATQHTVDDIIVEPMQFLVDENNCMPQEERQLKTPLTDVDDNSSEVPEVYVPIEQLRAMLNNIRDTTSHIRKLDEHLNDLKRQGVTTEQSKKRISGEWFTFDGQQYRLLDNNLVQPQLDEIYHGAAGHVLPDSCDLSGGFGKVRDQGQMGACAAFALTAVFEYMMRRLGRDVDALSPAFVYYHSRVIGGNHGIDSGATLRDSIKALSANGVCLEEFMPYTTVTPVTEPTDDANNDGQLRLVTGAAGIIVDDNDEDKTLHDVKSAIADGYPVVVALRVLDSFVSSTGFVTVPTPAELANEPSGGHAMVIVGYDDKTGYFYVRNSWGEKFGDKGYCYIPYSYVSSKDLCHGLVIIKSINMADAGKSIAPATGHMMDFDRTNAAIDMAITQNIINGQQKYLKTLELRYGSLKIAGDTLFADLGTPSKRKALRQHAHSRLAIALSQASTAIEEARAEQVQAVGDYKEKTREVSLKWWIAIGVMSVLTIGMLWFGYDSDYYTPLWVSGGSTAIFAIILALWKHTRRLELRELEAAHKARITKLVDYHSQCAARLRESNLKHEIAGRFVDEFRAMQQQLITRYNDISSMTGNLAAWYRNEEAKQSQMSSRLLPPLVALLDNKSLDAYFDAYADTITAGISVSHYLTGYDRNSAGLLTFQKNLKKDVLNWLSKQIADFDMAKLITGNATYGYVQLQQTLDGYVTGLLSMSQPFVMYRQLSGTTSPTIRLLTNVGGGNSALRQNIINDLRPCGLPTDALQPLDSPLRLTILQLHPLQLCDIV